MRGGNKDNDVLISIFCPDRTGLVAAITGRLFDLGTNLGDTTFAVLGSGAEFTAVCDLPSGLTAEEVEAELRGLPELAEARLQVTPFEMAPTHGPSGHITHRIELRGGDRPGLIARLSEVFVEFGANIVRLNAETVPGETGDSYITRIALSIPPERSETCLATVANTAGGLRLACRWERVS